MPDIVNPPPSEHNGYKSVPEGHKEAGCATPLVQKLSIPRPTAAAPQLRFDERNIHKQCVVCNQHKSGNLVPYRVELISRIGQEAVDEIESNHSRHRWTVEECRAIKAEYQQKLKDLRNSRSEAA